jgi:hypothetical protein
MRYNRSLHGRADVHLWLPEPGMARSACLMNMGTIARGLPTACARCLDPPLIEIVSISTVH